MRANVPNWLSTSNFRSRRSTFPGTFPSKLPNQSQYLEYTRYFSIFPVIPVILYCNGRSAGGVQDQDCTTCTNARPKVHLATQGSRDRTLLPVNIRVIVTVPARSCLVAGLLLYVQYSDSKALCVCPWVCPWRRSRQEQDAIDSSFPCKPQIYYCRKPKRDP